MVLIGLLILIATIVVLFCCKAGQDENNDNIERSTTLCRHCDKTCRPAEPCHHTTS